MSNLVEIGPVVLNIFNIILLFRFKLPFDKGVALHLKKLQFKLNIFYISILFSFKLPFEKGMVFHMNKFESPPLKDDLCKAWLKLT